VTAVFRFHDIEISNEHLIVDRGLVSQICQDIADSINMSNCKETS
jgi:hypothetical protein